jgi:hypothetical protein
VTAQGIAEAIEVLEEGEAALASLFDRLPENAAVRPATIGGGDWSAKDLLGHMAFWEELALEFMADWQARVSPRIGAVFAEGVDAANARNQARTRQQSLAEVRERASSAHQRLLAAIRAVPVSAWDEKPYYQTTPADRSFGQLLGGILGGPDRLFGHADAHVADLRAYVELAEET